MISNGILVGWIGGEHDEELSHIVGRLPMSLCNHVLHRFMYLNSNHREAFESNGNEFCEICDTLSMGKQN